jgi:hypothetical protein
MRISLVASGNRQIRAGSVGNGHVLLGGGEVNAAKMKGVSLKDLSIDPWSECIRYAAGSLLQICLEAEATCFLNAHRDLIDDSGKQRLVRNGYLPVKEIATRLGKLLVRVPRIRDRHGYIKFMPSLLPPYRRRMSSSISIDQATLLHSVFKPYPLALLAVCFGGGGVKVPSVMVQMIEAMWSEQVQTWLRGVIADRQSETILIALTVANMTAEKNAPEVLVLTIATADGAVIPAGMIEGHSDDANDWSKLLQDLRVRGMAMPPTVIASDREAVFQAAKSAFPGASFLPSAEVPEGEDYSAPSPKSIHPDQLDSRPGIGPSTGCPTSLKSLMFIRSLPISRTQNLT